MRVFRRVTDEPRWVVATPRFIDIPLHALSGAVKTTVGDQGDSETKWICKGLLRAPPRGFQSMSGTANDVWSQLSRYVVMSDRHVGPCRVPRPIPPNYKLLTEGGFFGFWSFYRDGFGMKTHGTGGSLTGVYGQFLNLCSEVRNMEEFSFMLSVFPSSYDSYECHPQLRKDDELLRSGRLKVWAHACQKDVAARLFLALIQADSVEVCKILDHGGAGGHCLCPFCCVRRLNRVDGGGGGG
jgi:hypothetical protein